jgi:hypothetical protein
MARTYDANGETWTVRLSDETPHEGVRPLIFHCESNTSRGWRVVEVSVDEYAGDDRIDGLSEGELGQLFDRSQPFDFAHDPKALEGHIGDSGASR